ncbi:MAG: hypothetical protein ACMG55_11570 [Microcoleus sp.]
MLFNEYREGKQAQGTISCQFQYLLRAKKMHDYKQLTLADAAITQLQKLLSEPFCSLEQAEKSRLQIRALLELQELFSKWKYN